MSIEVMTVAAGALLLGTLSVVLLDGGVLFSRPLWLDEYHTLFVARAETIGDSVRALAAGADNNPPLLHLLVRPIALAAAGAVAVWLRIFSYVIVWLGLVTIYALLRRHVAVVPALAGSLSVWSHPLVQRHAFEARFYGPLLLFAALFAAAAGMDPERERSRMRDVALAIAAVLLCTIHYFGIFTWTLMVGATAVAIRNKHKVIRYMAPAMAGPLSLAAFIPLVRAQREALSVQTWIPSFTMGQLTEMLSYFFGHLAFLGVLLLWALCSLLLPRLLNGPMGERRDDPSADVASLAACGLFPVVLALLSAVVQPAMVNRYAITTVLAFGPFVAFSLARFRKPLQVTVLLALVVVSTQNLREQVARAENHARWIEEDARSISELVPAGSIVVVGSRHSLYPLLDRAVSPGSDLVFPIFEASEVLEVYPPDGPREREGREVRVEQDVAAAHVSAFGVPRLMPASAIRRLKVFFYLDRGSGPDYYLENFFPGYSYAFVAPRLLRVEMRVGDVTEGKD